MTTVPSYRTILTSSPSVSPRMPPFCPRWCWELSPPLGMAWWSTTGRIATQVTLKNEGPHTQSLLTHIKSDKHNFSHKCSDVQLTDCALNFLCMETWITSDIFGVYLCRFSQTQSLSRTSMQVLALEALGLNCCTYCISLVQFLFSAPINTVKDYF